MPSVRKLFLFPFEMLAKTFAALAHATIIPLPFVLELELIVQLTGENRRNIIFECSLIDSGDPKLLWRLRLSFGYLAR